MSDTLDHLTGEGDGYCKHGVYVGGCGVDWMCSRCENDLDDDDE